MTSTGIGPPKRDTYRHGDLRRALLEAGTELARGGGPDAVVLREATRRAGVAPSAAHRHLADRRAPLDAARSPAPLCRAGAWAWGWAGRGGATRGHPAGGRGAKRGVPTLRRPACAARRGLLGRPGRAGGGGAARVGRSRQRH